MFRKTLIALVIAIPGTAFVSTAASARDGFWHGDDWGWRGPPPGAVGVVGVGVASTGWGPPCCFGPGFVGWGGWGGPPEEGWNTECTRWRRVWTEWGWRVVPVNVC